MNDLEASEETLLRAALLREEVRRLRRQAEDTEAARRAELEALEARLGAERDAALQQLRHNRQEWAAGLRELRQAWAWRFLAHAARRWRQLRLLAGARTEAARVAQSQGFDAAWYRGAYPDARASGLAPALHYVRFGVADGRDPGPGFNAKAYRQAHPIVELCALNPLLHAERGRAAEDA